MTKGISDEAIKYLNNIHGNYEMVNRGWRNTEDGYIGWHVKMPENDRRWIYIIENYQEDNSDRVCLFTMVESGGDEFYGLIATGHYEDIQKIVESIKGLSNCI